MDELASLGPEATLELFDPAKSAQPLSVGAAPLVKKNFPMPFSTVLIRLDRRRSLTHAPRFGFFFGPGNLIGLNGALLLC